MKDIRIDVGVCTALTVDLSNFDFAGIKELIFTVKNSTLPESPVIIERIFTEAKKHRIIVTAEESIRLTPYAQYDFDKVLIDGTRHKEGDNGKIVLRKGVGDCIEYR